MGGRGASSGGGGIPEISPSGVGGSGGNGDPMDQNPGVPETLEQALGKKGRPKSDKEAVLKANPFYDGSYREYSENCQRAVVATEARFRGYDVIAQPTYEGDTMPFAGNWRKSFTNPTIHDVGRSTPNAARKSVEHQMSQFGDGTRAVMEVEWKGRDGGGHVINVIQRNGTTIYYDGQVGARYNVTAFYNRIRTKQIKLVRVDNLSFSDGAREAVRQNPVK